MERMKSVVLEVKEGRGFEGFKHDVIIQADLDRVVSKTLPARATREGIVYFNNDLIWELQNKYLRRMKMSSVSLKIECFSMRNKNEKTRVGYLALKLKTLKEARAEEDIKGEWLKLLGVNGEAKQTSPSVYLKCYIQDSTVGEDNVAKKSDKTVDNISEVKSVLSSKKGVIQIGPVDDDTDCFLLGIKLAQMKDLNVLCPGEYLDRGDYVFLYTLLGYDIQREPFKDLCNPSPQEKVSIKLKCEVPVLKLYLETNPYLTVRLMKGDTMLGYAHVDLRFLIPVENTKHLRVSKEKHLVFLSPIYESATVKEIEASADLLLTFDLLDNTGHNSSSASVNSPLKADHKLDSCPEKEESKTVGKFGPGIAFPKQCNQVTYKANMFNAKDVCACGDSSAGELSHKVEEGTSKMKAFNESVAHEVVKELEEWKEMEKELFVEELRKKEKQHLDLLSTEWQVKRERLESNLSKVISQNNTLSLSLQGAISDLHERSRRVAEKEKRINLIKEDMERRFNLKLQDLQSASRRMEDDCNHKVEALETRKNGQELRYVELQQENLALKEKVKDMEEEIVKLKKESLTKDQTASLLSEVKSLQEKIDVSDQSKIFYKEQWAKTAREIHRLKTEHQESLHIQIKHNKEELRQLGLCSTNEDDGNEEPRLPHQIQRLFQRRSLMNKSGDGDIGSYRRLELPRSPSVPSRMGGKLQNLIEERNTLLRESGFSVEDERISELNLQIRSLMTLSGDAGS